MSEKPQEDFEYNLKNLYNIALGKNLAEQIGEKTKTATAGIVSGVGAIPLLTTATGIIGGFGVGGLAATGLGLLAEKNLKKDSGQAFGAGLGMGGKIATSIGLASSIPNIGVFGFLFAAFGTLGALNILYHYLVNGKAKAKEVIEEQVQEEKNPEKQILQENQEELPVQTQEEKTTGIVEKIEEVVDNLEESLEILVDGNEKKMSLKYIKNKV